MMRIYLDMCCFNRPYDPQDQLKISMETQSKLKIQRLIEEGKLELIGSYTLDYECSNVPVPMRKRSIKEFLYKNMSGYVGIERDKEISIIAKKNHGYKYQAARCLSRCLGNLCWLLIFYYHGHTFIKI